MIYKNVFLTWPFMGVRENCLWRENLQLLFKIRGQQKICRLDSIYLFIGILIQKVSCSSWAVLKTLHFRSGIYSLNVACCLRERVFAIRHMLIVRTPYFTENRMKIKENPRKENNKKQSNYRQFLIALNLPYLK